MFSKEKKIVEKMISPKQDRRLLSNVPDPEGLRRLEDRRGNREQSVRYEGSFDVLLQKQGAKEKIRIPARAADISATGILVRWNHVDFANYKSSGCLESLLEKDGLWIISFDLPPGVMTEGYESKVKTDAILVRSESDGQQEVTAFSFKQSLTSYYKKKRWNYSIYSASALLFAVTLFVVLMRIEGVIYFKYHMLLYLYSLIAAIFLLSRYLFGALSKDVAINPDFTPGVSIIIPCFNEEEWIHRTISSCINQEYPIDKLEVIVVDDRSTDKSVEQMQDVIQRIHMEAERFQTKKRLQYVVMEENGGKREALVKGVRLAKHDLVVFVDSDSFLQPDAIRHLVQPFQDPKMGGVAGRTDVENKYTNFITKLQTVRYYIAFRIMKAAESYFDSVTCLSGPLSCYRKELIEKHQDAWLNQKFLGQPATFGDDRAMTNFILRTHRTGYQDSAVCSTIVPSQMNVFLKQQMRWKRSWLRESLIAGSFIWRKEPFMALFFYVGLIVPIAAPIIVLYNLIYVPLVHQIFPFTFLMGLLFMALMMSFAHLLLKRSRLFIYGLIFCLFYEFILLWQMPVAWVTFWKSTWGTRETPQDIEAQNKKNARKNRNKIKKEMSL